MSLYDNLGVEPGASPEDIKRAYRKGAQKNHPDKGGDPDKFHAIQRAYDVLGDAQRRKRYDETGDDGLPQDSANQVQGIIASCMFEVLDAQEDLAHRDIIGAMRKRFQGQIEQIKRDKVGCEAAIKRYQGAQARFKRADDGDNIFVGFLQHKVQGLQQQLASLEQSIVLGQEALAVLEAYQYQWEPKSPQAFSGGFVQGKEDIEYLDTLAREMFGSKGQNPNRGRWRW